MPEENNTFIGRYFIITGGICILTLAIYPSRIYLIIKAILAIFGLYSIYLGFRG